MPRLFTFVNLAPVQNPNPYFGAGNMPSQPVGPAKYYLPTQQWEPQGPVTQYLMDAGAAGIFGVGNGTINRAAVWNGLTPAQAAVGLNWANETNCSDPPTVPAYATDPGSVLLNLKTSIAACVSLANGKANLYGATGEPSRAIMFDIEGSNWFASSDGAANLPNIEAALATANAYKAQSPVGWYMLLPVVPTPTNAALAAQYNALLGPYLDYVVTGNYTWDVPASSPSIWFDGVAAQTAAIKRYCGDAWKVATVCPSYQIYWPQNDPANAPKNNAPVPTALWEKQLKFLANLGYDLCLFPPPTFEDATMANLKAFLAMAS